MKTLRTPDARFENLPDYPFPPNYVDVDEMRMHYVDEGPRDGDVVLLLHGEPSWSYLYRTMIPPLGAAGLRVIAPDLIGFGRSDKPTRRSDYSYAAHVAWMVHFIEQLDLHGITLFCQDWGSLIGLRAAAENEQRFARIALGNGGLPTGDQELPRAFRVWRAFAHFSPWFPIGRIVQSGTVTELSDEVVSAYDAPFPSSKFKAGARAFPMLVPTTPDDPASEANRAAWKAFSQWQKPFLTTFSDRDPITRGGEVPWQQTVPGAKNRDHVKIKNAGHFLQEDKGPELVEVLLKFIRES
ncbi:MAG: haloalkane dehalogenase [Gammaproteobacteria bacterium]|nr:haloalkane dehalogenase [Gammaproteobacteria bacterium]MDH3363471.1 haloalkane dehalogenase [Gammaproteobacteria bacterium]MDH3480740.1 haloalkane dehalogenase [Gammaproteobacteria bacterium]